MNATASLAPAFRLTPGVIHKVVPTGRPGTYRLHRHEAVIYLGRSDTDLRRRLLEHAISRRGDHFTWQIHLSAHTAWTDECSQWHHLPRLAENLVHPARPDSSNDRCAFCPDTFRIVDRNRDAQRNLPEF